MELALQDNPLSVKGILRRIFCAIYAFAAAPFAKKRSATKAEAQEQYLRGIMDKHGNRLLRLAYSYLHNMQDSEEILQDVLMKLLDKAPEFESEEHEKAWLLRVTANLSKNRIE